MVRVVIVLSWLMAMLTACGGGGPRAGVDPAAGKIVVQFEYQASDLAPPPAGFHVYRSVEATGPFSRITAVPIPPMPGARAGSRQVLLGDRGLVPGRAYFYYIERVEADGRTRKVTTVTRAEAILPDENGVPAQTRRPREESTGQGTPATRASRP